MRLKYTIMTLKDDKLVCCDKRILLVLILLLFTALSAQPHFHIVKPGDTLQSIARLYNFSVIELCIYNSLSDSYTELTPGQWIWLEGGHEDWQEEYDETDPEDEDYALDEMDEIDESNTQVGTTPSTWEEPPPEIPKPLVPVNFVRITSEFGYRRGRMHYGIDFAAPRGTPIQAAMSGVVEVSRYSRSFGNKIVIRHDDGTQAIYAHNDKNLVYAGNYVLRGEVIGYVGRSGRATGYHLHFEFHLNGTPINPRRLFRDL